MNRMPDRWENRKMNTETDKKLCCAIIIMASIINGIKIDKTIYWKYVFCHNSISQYFDSLYCTEKKNL